MARNRRIRHHPLVKVFADRVRERRRALGLSQQALAEKAALNPAYLGRLERGEVSPGLDMLARVAEALGCAPAQLIATEADTPADGGKLAAALAEGAFTKVAARRDPAVLQSLAVLLAAVDEGLSRRR